MAASVAYTFHNVVITLKLAIDKYSDDIRVE